MLGPPITPVEVTARIGPPDFETIPMEGLARHSCPQPFRRDHLEALGPPATPVKVAAHSGQSVVEAVPVEGLACHSWPKPEVG